MMNYDDFKRLLEDDKARHPDDWMLMEEMNAGEPLATDEEIAHVENSLGVKLPRDYVALLQDFGGGIVGGPEIYSAHQSSRLFILRYQLPPDSVRNFVAVMDNGCGDYYGFKVEQGQCESALTFCDHESGLELQPTEWQSLPDYIAACVRPPEAG